MPSLPRLEDFPESELREYRRILGKYHPGARQFNNEDYQEMLKCYLLPYIQPNNPSSRSERLRRFDMIMRPSPEHHETLYFYPKRWADGAWRACQTAIGRWLAQVHPAQTSESPRESQ